MDPRVLTAPDPRYTLECVSDSDAEGLTAYRLADQTADGGAKELRFLAPSDSEAVAFASAWHRKDHFVFNHARYRWYQTLQRRAESAQQRWREAAREGQDHDVRREMLEEYLEADHQAKLLLQAFVGRPLPLA